MPATRSSSNGSARTGWTGRRPPDGRRNVAGSVWRAAGQVAVALLALVLVAERPVWAGARPASPIGRTCDLIAAHADLHGLPRDFLARLIWKESRFDAGAVSPAGAEGIAQFMPGTAALRGLDDAFDLEQAIPASAAYLADLRADFGNLGLAAAAYNSGEARTRRWLRSGGFLPMETENYVLDIMGAPADSFAAGDVQDAVAPLDEDRSFSAACRRLPAAGASVVAMASTPVLPWGAQVAGSFNRQAAVRRWLTLKQRHADLLGQMEPVVSRVRTPRGRGGLHAVRIGAEDRRRAEEICASLRRSGAACIVMRNR